MKRFEVKLDEILAGAHAEILRRRGYDVDRVTDEGLSGSSDEKLWETVVEEERLLITLDLDFSDIRRFPPGRHPGLVLLRPRTKGRRAVSMVLQRLLREHRLEDLQGCFVVADPRRTRIRRPPPTDSR